MSDTGLRERCREFQSRLTELATAQPGKIWWASIKFPDVLAKFVEGAAYRDAAEFCERGKHGAEGTSRWLIASALRQRTPSDSLAALADYGRRVQLQAWNEIKQEIRVMRSFSNLAAFVDERIAELSKPVTPVSAADGQ